MIPVEGEVDLFSVVLLARSPLFVITATNGALISAKNSPGSDKKAGIG